MTLVDFYGFGETPYPQYPLFVEDYAKAVVEIINKYKMNKVILVGHSFGGRVAIRLASKYGYLLDKVVLTDSAGVLPKRGVTYYAKILRHKLLTKLHISHTAGSADYVVLSETAKQTFKNIVNEDLAPEMEKITLPVLLIWGNEDRDTPIYMAKRMVKKIKSSALVVLSGVGHFAYLESGQLFINILQSFFSDGGDDKESCGRVFWGNRRRIVTIPLSLTK